MKFLELYEKRLSAYKIKRNTFLVVLFINMVASFFTKSISPVFISLALIFALYRENKEQKKVETFTFQLMPHDLESDGYYRQSESDEFLKSYTYYYDKDEKSWIVEHPISKEEAKIIKLNELDKFEFFSTVKDYQPILRLKRYELKSEVAEWFEKHPEIKVNLRKTKITGELGFENIYKE